jgi:hypothetical protein
MGIVGEPAHRVRLREANVPLDDIFVPYPEQVDIKLSASEMVRRHHISVEYRDGESGDYQQVNLEKVDDTSALWKPHVPEDQFPLVVLRARFPPQKAGQTRRILNGPVGVASRSSYPTSIRKEIRAAGISSTSPTGF